MSGAQDKGHFGEATVEAWEEFEALWIDARISEISDFSKDPDAYETWLLELIEEMEGLRFHELNRLYQSLKIELWKAFAFHQVCRMTEATKNLLIFLTNPSFAHVLSPATMTSLRRLEHLHALREVLKATAENKLRSMMNKDDTV